MNSLVIVQLPYGRYAHVFERYGSIQFERLYVREAHGVPSKRLGYP